MQSNQSMRNTRVLPGVSPVWLRRTAAIFHGMRELPELLLRWQDRVAQRRQLAGMGERLLKDIGVSSADAAQEAAKPFWRA